MFNIAKSLSVPKNLQLVNSNVVSLVLSGSVSVVLSPINLPRMILWLFPASASFLKNVQFLNLLVPSKTATPASLPLLAASPSKMIVVSSMMNASDPSGDVVLSEAKIAVLITALLAVKEISFILNPLSSPSFQR